MKRLLSLRRSLTFTPPSLWAWFTLACALTGLMGSYLTFLLERQSVAIAFRAMLYPKFWLTALLLFLLTGLGALLTRSLLAGWLLAGLPFFILGVINAYKLAITGTAFSLNDFLLAGNVGGIIQLNAASLVPSFCTVLALLLFALWAVGLWFVTPALRPPAWRASLCLALVPLAVLVGVFWLGLDPLVLSAMDIPLERGNLAQTLVNQYTGLPLGLARTLKIRQVWAAPLSDQQMDELLTRAEDQLPPAAREGDHPNVILILSESFFDATTLPGVAYDEDPIPDFHALQAEGVSGAFHTRSLGYGTCNIELEVLTGVNTHLLSGEDLYSMDPQRLARVPALPQLLNEAGYRSVMLHMYTDGIYDREHLMEAVGFDERYFADNFTPIDPLAAQAGSYGEYLERHISGSYYSDAYMTDLLTGLYEQKEEDKPLFTFAISMENHTPHNAEKYSPSERTVSFSADLSPEANEALAVASQGCANASQALGRLCDFFRDYDEPTVILFFGDHRPGLGVEDGALNRVYSQLYDAAGQWNEHATVEQTAELRTTEYLIWANDPSLLPASPGTRRPSSSNYFGLSVLEAAGVPKPLYWRLLERLRQTRLMDTDEYSMGVDGVATLSMPQSGAEYTYLTEMSAVLQNILYGNNAFSQRLRR